MIHAFRFLEGDKQGEWLEGEKALEWLQTLDWVKNDRTIWVDLEEPTEEEEEQIFSVMLRPHALTIEDMTRPRRVADQQVHFPKVEEFEDYLFVITNPLRSDLIKDSKSLRKAIRDRQTHSQLSALMTRHILITHHLIRLSSVDQVRQYLMRHCPMINRGPDFVFHLILDGIVDEYSPVVDSIESRLDALELRLFHDSRPVLVQHLLRMKRFIISLKKTIVLEREVLTRLSRGEFSLVDEREMVYYRNVYDHLLRYGELIENAREMIFDLLQTHLAAVSNRMNSVMKILAIVSTTILPMTLIAGIYGMNFDNTPEFKWKYGFEYAIGLMAVTAATALGLFRWRGWL
jgi:magnesium transporter